MALTTEDNAKCPKCGREPVRIYRTAKGVMCGKCLNKEIHAKRSN